MDNGKNIAVGTADELKRMIKKSEKITIEAAALSKEDIQNILALPYVYDVDYNNRQLNVVCSGGRHNLVHILEYLQQHDIAFGRVYSELPTLNDVFLEITGKELRDQASKEG